MLRLFLVLLALLGFALPALASSPGVSLLGRDRGEHREHDREEHEDDDEDEEDDHEKRRERRTRRAAHDEDEEEEHYAYDDDFVYYGRVSTAAPLAVGRWRISGELPLLDYLAPGMEVAVRGEVEDGHLVVHDIRVLAPRDWAYFEGPTREGWLRVWFSGGKPWRTQVIPPTARARLVACFEDGRWRGLPPELVPKLEPPAEGLWELEGLIWQGEIRWTRREYLGSCGR